MNYNLAEGRHSQNMKPRKKKGKTINRQLFPAKDLFTVLCFHYVK